MVTLIFLRGLCGYVSVTYSLVTPEGRMLRDVPNYLLTEKPNPNVLLVKPIF